MENRLKIQALALDLKRVAIAYHAGTIPVAERFLNEALRKRKDIDLKRISSRKRLYVQPILSKLEKIYDTPDLLKRAEDALLYSTLLLTFTK